ncbi:DBF4-type zinc finger-containing protein 2 isoform X2 [Hemicordylus capensis]|nr:DBF4-type zinc finger-containing protein 2 isoform X2 [Hemicordylus capensis]XP_053140104.1 DBF4-type zinc finger-containing protein 2 isoform X2 [Hemicordylus capensis]XP_053140105.1 DBF4-type zinc finger-containing protein 2 isoform X2 [Hemicordylus capensis]
MFDRNKQGDEASAVSAQGVERKGNEGSLRQESSSSLSIQGPELAGPGVSAVQNRQGYCNCCHVHYSNLEQHVFSSQHRHFATYCRNRMDTTSLMERFLQDVLQHHPYRYHDNRPTYDDVPFIPVSKEGAGESPLSVEVLEKESATSSGEEPSIDSGFTAESGCPASQRSQEELKETYLPLTPTQNLEKEQEHNLGTSQQTMGISHCTKNVIQAEGAMINDSSHEDPFSAVNLSLHPLPVSHSPSTPHVLAKNNRYSVVPDLVSNKCEQSKQGICHQAGLLNPNLSSFLQPAQSVTVSLSHESPVGSQGNSLISGQLLFKQDGLQPQEETQLFDTCLRDTSNPVGSSSSLTFRAASQLAGGKESKLGRSVETSVDEIIEDIILKYCYGTLPKELPCKAEETNSCVNILSLLDHSSLHGSDISFDCDAAVPSGTVLPQATVKNLELLKKVQVNLRDENYGSQLSSILKNSSVQQAVEGGKDGPVHNKEPVLPALPHVPPSFVGKTWSQIMYEDDMKIEALVRDFREGRFRCHFDTESLANCARRRKKRQKDEVGSSAIVENNTETVPAPGLPGFTDILSGGSDFSNLSVTSETQHIQESTKRPKKRTWRLASRCQVVKVSHGTQTSVVHYPVVKQKIIRKDHEPLDQQPNFLWSDNEKTPNMKTRLCALKLPESYTKIMSPLQPQTMVYVLSCPERKQFRSKAADIPKMRRSHNSTESKDSVRYRYKQCSIKYYDPLTNRVLKTPPKSRVGGKTKKPPHVRQLFRSLSLDANRKKQTDGQYECVPPKPFNSPEFHSSSASFMPDPVKENDMNSSHKTDASSISTERSECLVCSNSEKSCKHLVLSPLNSRQSQQKSDFGLTPFNRKEVQPPLKSLEADCLEKGNSKGMWQRGKGSNQEPGFSKKASGAAFVRHSLVRKSRRKQPSRTTAQQKVGRRRRKMSCALKSSAMSASRHQTKKATVRKHLKKEKSDKILKITRKPKRTFLNTTALMGIPEKRQRGTARASSNVKKWEMNGDKSLLCTVK